MNADADENKEDDYHDLCY